LGLNEANEAHGIQINGNLAAGPGLKCFICALLASKDLHVNKNHRMYLVCDAANQQILLFPNCYFFKTFKLFLRNVFKPEE
jgi:hypothetical protein